MIIALRLFATILIIPSGGYMITILFQAIDRQSPEALIAGVMLAEPALPAFVSGLVLLAFAAIIGRLDKLAKVSGSLEAPTETTPNVRAQARQDTRFI
ncbi:MAG: hypothetical protein AAGG69_11645 [Pseudomonadota bacterium]